MNLINRRPGFERTPAGLEWSLIRRLPLVVVTGSAGPILCLLAERLVAGSANRGAAAKPAMTFKIALASVLVLYWTIAVVLGCLIVMVAKGPAYVADAYPLPDADAPPP